MGFLTLKLHRTKPPELEAEPNDETTENPDESPNEPSQKIPLAKLRDLRPEKDPIGAGRDTPRP